jgi:UDP-2,4-diacetamido-2,4,6-trideoxy-beta-L-altropyranose hydrolase
MPPGRTLVFRADAAPHIGTGHVMRCLALAQAWQDEGGQCVFLMADGPPGVEERVRHEGCAVENVAVEPGGADDAALTARRAADLGAGWVVVDGYHFGDAFEVSLRHAGLRLLAVDDCGHARHDNADLVLNQNAHAREQDYPGPAAAGRLLLGPRHALLRREFRRWRGWQRATPAVARRVLVTLGGADPDNVTGTVVHGLRLAAPDGLHARVLVGPSNPHGPALRAAVDGAPGIELLGGTDDMPGLMAWSELAVGAGGSTCWEMAFLGLPFLVTVLADNQRPVEDYLAREGVAVGLGWGTDLSPDALARAFADVCRSAGRREAMSRAGRRLVDGEGAGRVLAAMREKSS